MTVLRAVSPRHGGPRRGVHILSDRLKLTHIEDTIKHVETNPL